MRAPGKLLARASLMGPFATLMLRGCLQAIGYLLYFTGALALVAAAAVAWRAETVPSPASLAMFAACCLAGGFACLAASRRIT